MSDWKNFVKEWRKQPQNIGYTYSQSLVMCAPLWEEQKRRVVRPEDIHPDLKHNPKIDPGVIKKPQMKVEQRSVPSLLGAKQPKKVIGDIPVEEKTIPSEGGEFITPPMKKTRKPRCTKSAKLQKQIESNQRRLKLLELEQEKLRLELEA